MLTKASEELILRTSPQWKSDHQMRMAKPISELNPEDGGNIYLRYARHHHRKYVPCVFVIALNAYKLNEDELALTAWSRFLNQGSVAVTIYFN